MNISKDVFIRILEMLENDGCIDFKFYKNKNAIEVYSDADNATYYFDDNNNLINPQVFKIQEKIKKLEEEKNKLENKLKSLTKD